MTEYVAEGFIEDSSHLLRDFLKLKSLEFKDFAEVWKELNFSLIFTDRFDAIENNEFVNEVFRITTMYLMEETFEMHVGAIYMLYALFETQICHNHPPVKIRIEMKHFRVIRAVRSTAIEKKMDTLHYIIDYLIEHAFLYVACQTLRGPLVAGIPSPYDVNINQRKEKYLEAFEEYFQSTNLETLRDLCKEYNEEKKKVPEFATVAQSSNKNIYEEALETLKTLEAGPSTSKSTDNIGGARAKIKSKAFKMKQGKQKKDPKNSDEPVKGTLTKDGKVVRPGLRVKEVKVPKRVPKEHKRPGRPRLKPREPSPPPIKDSSDEEIDISYLLAQQKLYYPDQMFAPCPAVKSKRRPYYEVSPKKGENDKKSDSESDSDMPD